MHQRSQKLNAPVQYLVEPVTHSVANLPAAVCCNFV